MGGEWKNSNFTYNEKKSSPAYASPSMRTIDEKKKNNTKYCARLTQWLHRLEHFDIEMQPFERK